MKKRPSSPCGGLEDKRSRAAPAVPPRLAELPPLARWRAPTLLLCDGSSRRDFHAWALGPCASSRPPRFHCAALPPPGFQLPRLSVGALSGRARQGANPSSSARPHRRFYFRIYGLATLFGCVSDLSTRAGTPPPDEMHPLHAPPIRNIAWYQKDHVFLVPGGRACGPGGGGAGRPKKRARRHRPTGALLVPKSPLAESWRKGSTAIAGRQCMARAGCRLSARGAPLVPKRRGLFGTKRRCVPPRRNVGRPAAYGSTRRRHSPGRMPYSRSNTR